jgi:hypothetical protein
MKAARYYAPADRTDDGLLFFIRARLPFRTLTR